MMYPRHLSVWFSSRSSDVLRSLALVLGLACVAARPAISQESQPPSQSGSEPAVSILRGALGLPFIDQQTLTEAVYELSSPEFEGRLTGTTGHDLAVRYAAERFRGAGLRPGGDDGSFLQPFIVEANEVTGPMELRIEHDGWSGPPYRFGRDYVARGFTGSGRVENAEVVFVGYGLVDPASGWDDYEGVDARGKVAVMFMGTPPGATEWGDRSRPRYKASLAADRGVRAVLLIDEPRGAALSPIVSVYHGQEGTQREDVPQLAIRSRVADDLLRGSAHTVESLQARVASSGQPFPIELETRVTLEAHARYTSERMTWNVVGWVEGSDASVSNEYVIVGGHLDHVGQQAGVLFAGAQDNASGSVMVMAMAEAMARSPIKPRRSVAFVLFAGEELYLLGSDYFATHPPRPITEAVGMMNLDMVGTGPVLRMDGGATTPDFQRFAVEADGLYGGFGLADGQPTPAVPGASDHSAFINAGVPTVYFHSSGAGGQAHTAADVPEKIDYDAYYRTTLVLYLTLFQMADRP
ncbi:MAG: M20/M25/M40 family metallo-hydrolase [Gemmatimonadota bacterium]